MAGLSDDDLATLARALPGRTISAEVAVEGTRYAVVGEGAPWYVTRLEGLYAVLDGRRGLLAEVRILEEALASQTSLSSSAPVAAP